MKNKEQQSFNNLTPAQAERVAVLMEECSEVIHVCGKILRHGYGSYHPELNYNNKKMLEHELGDLQHAVIFCCKNGDVDGEAIQLAANKKRDRIKQYLHHN